MKYYAVFYFNNEKDRIQLSYIFGNKQKAEAYALTRCEGKVEEREAKCLSYQCNPYQSIEYSDFESMGTKRSCRGEDMGKYYIVKGDEEARQEVLKMKEEDNKRMDSYYSQPWV